MAEDNADLSSEDQLWNDILHQLEIMAENDAASEAGFEDDGIDDFEDEFDEEGKRRTMGSQISRLTDDDGGEPEPPLSELELRTILHRLRDRELPDVGIALQLVDQIRDHLQHHMGALGHIPAPKQNGKVIIVGDLHGHLNDLLRILDTYGEPSENLVYLFNGDFVDRGVWGPEVLFYLFCYRLLYPNHIFLNRGNHETKFCTDRYGFHQDLRLAYGVDADVLYEHIQDAFDQLSLCFVIGSHVFVVHGGLPAHFVTLRDLDKLRRGPFPMQGRSAKIRTFQALLWSDPKDVAGPSNRGMGCHFSADMTQEFLSQNGGMKCIVRSHECIASGYVEHHDSLCRTVFSASNYDANNDGTVAVVTDDMEVRPGERWNEPYDANDAVAARSGWAAEAKNDKDAMAALANRIQNDQRWSCSPKQRCMEVVSSLIFLARPQILEKLVAADQQDGHADGFVKLEEWEEVMVLTTRTPLDFPWTRLSEYLCDFVMPGEDDLFQEGGIRYMDFMLRFDSPFSAWLGTQWTKAVLTQAALKTHSYGDLFNTLDTRCVGYLQSQAMLTLLHKVTPFVKPSDSRESLNEAMRVYMLFRIMDKSGSGTITREDFVRQLFSYGNQKFSTTQCRNGHSISLEGPMGFWQSLVKIRICAKCDKEIDPKSSVLSCNQCVYHLCRKCALEIRMAKLRSFMELRRAEKAQFRVQQMWEICEQALRATFSSKSDIYALFSLVDDGKGRVNAKNFTKHMGRALRQEQPVMQALFGVLCCFVLEQRRALKMGKGPLRTLELAECLALLSRAEDPVWQKKLKDMMKMKGGGEKKDKKKDKKK